MQEHQTNTPILQHSNPPTTIVYMDHATTTPVHPDVLRAMLPYFTEQYGSPSQIYSLGQAAADPVQEARLNTARLIGTRAKNIYFTSGATESNNWAIKGAAAAPRVRGGNHILTCATEHSSVLEPCKFLAKEGFDVTVLPVDGCGMVSPDDVKSAITPKTILITIGHGNIETGTIQPVAQIGAIAREHGVLFHTNAAQTVGKIDVNVEEIQCDLLSFSAHKFYGPKGIGALYMAKPRLIASLHHGGAQERNLRGGTHNVPGIIGMGKAAELAMKESGVRSKELGAAMQEEMKDILTPDSSLLTPSLRVAALRDRLQNGIQERIKDVHIVARSATRLPGNLCICVDGVEGEAMLLHLDMNGICVSSGSACTAGALGPSHVLLAMGISREQAHGSIRFTLGAHNTGEHVERVLDVFPKIVATLRRMSPTYKKGVRS